MSGLLINLGFFRDNENIIAKLNLEVEDVPDRGRSLEETDTELEKIFQDVVSSGKVGSLTIDRQYLVFNSIKGIVNEFIEFIGLINPLSILACTA